MLRRQTSNFTIKVARVLREKQDVKGLQASALDRVLPPDEACVEDVAKVATESVGRVDRMS